MKTARIFLYFFVAVVPIIVWNGTLTAVDIKHVLIYFLVPVIWLGILHNWVCRSCIVFPRWPVASGGLLILFYWTILFVSSRWHSAGTLADVIVGITLFLEAAIILDNQEVRERFIVLWQTSAAIVAIYFLAQQAGVDFVSWEAQDIIPPGSTFGNRNHALFFLLGSAPFGIYLAVTAKRAGKIIGGTAALLAVCCIISSRSRIAPAILILMLPAYLNFFRTRVSSPGSRRIITITAAGLSVAIGIAGVILAVWLGNLSYMKISELSHFRLHIWSSAWRLAMQNPVFGNGTGSFPILFPEYRAQFLAAVWNQTRFLEHCHNEYLEIIAENGIIGLVLFISFIGITAGFALRRLRRHGGDKPLLFFSCASLAGMLLFSSVSVAPRYLHCMIFIWLSLALCHVSACGANTARRLRRTATRLLMGTMAVFGCFALWFVVMTSRRFLSDVSLKRAVDIAPAPNRHGQIRHAIDWSLELNPSNVRALYQKADFYFQCGQLDSALAIYLQIQRTRPHFQNIHYHCGVIYHQKGLYGAAIQELGWVVARYPHFEQALLLWAESFYYERRFEQCLAVCQHILNVNPSHGKARFLKSFVENKITQPPPRAID